MFRLLLSALVLCAGLAFTQTMDSGKVNQRPPQERRGGDMLKEFQTLSAKLALSDSQAVLVKAVYVNYRQQIDSARAQGGSGRERMGGMRDIMQSMDKEINSVLTDQQKEKYKEYKQERRERMRARMQE